MPKPTAFDVELLLDQHAEERQTERAHDLARQDRTDALIAEAFERRGAGRSQAVD